MTERVAKLGARDRDAGGTMAYETPRGPGRVYLQFHGVCFGEEEYSVGKKEMRCEIEMVCLLATLPPDMKSLRKGQWMPQRESAGNLLVGKHRDITGERGHGKPLQTTGASAYRIGEGGETGSARLSLRLQLNSIETIPILMRSILACPSILAVTGPLTETQTWTRTHRRTHANHANAQLTRRLFSNINQLERSNIATRPHEIWRRTESPCVKTLPPAQHPPAIPMDPCPLPMNQSLRSLAKGPANHHHVCPAAHGAVSLQLPRLPPGPLASSQSILDLGLSTGLSTGPAPQARPLGALHSPTSLTHSPDRVSSSFWLGASYSCTPIDMERIAYSNATVSFGAAPTALERALCYSLRSSVPVPSPIGRGFGLPPVRSPDAAGSQPQNHSER
ncbi:hypothetical protein EDB80DRAFT_688931 [Ilyonectria destructans]|nr:hypothetical protein EDB80DRAFT_688931 [Ilyonectria destructans]